MPRTARRPGPPRNAAARCGEAPRSGACTVDSCQWMAAASAAWLARPSRPSSASRGSSSGSSTGHGAWGPPEPGGVPPGPGDSGARRARQHRQLLGGQRLADAMPRARGEVVQDRVRGDLHHPAAAGQPAQEQGVALLRRARLERADDLGPAGGQAHPPGIRPAGQGFADRIGAARAWSAAGRTSRPSPAGLRSPRRGRAVPPSR